MEPKGLLEVTGTVGATSGRTVDRLGDVYEYVIINDEPINNILVPHPLQNYLMSDEEQRFLITSYWKGHVLTGIQNEGGMHLAKPLSIGFSQQTLLAIIGGVFLLFFFSAIGMTPQQQAEGLKIGLGVFALCMGLAWLSNVGPRLAKSVNHNIDVLRAEDLHFASRPTNDPMEHRPSMGAQPIA